MQCFSPLSVPRVGGHGPQDRVTVPCGRCSACLHNKRQEWAVRLRVEMRVSPAHFVTLTYADASVPIGDHGMPSVSKRDIQLFMKRLRKSVSNAIKYFLVSEYGTLTGRPHYHAIMFNLPTFPNKLVMDAWNLGHVMVVPASAATVLYTLKYIIEADSKADERYLYVEPPFRLISKGLGSSYALTSGKYHRADYHRNYVVQEDGIKARLPRYLRDRIYSKIDQQKQSIYAKSLMNKELKCHKDFKDEFESQVAYTDMIKKTVKANSKL